MAELHRVLGSSEFSRAAQLRRLLDWLCRRCWSGRHEAPTEYEVGVHALGRKPDFTPHTDSIVRKEMARLRTKLSQYYQTAGQENPARILIEKACYCPRLVPRPVPLIEKPIDLTVLVLPFRAFGWPPADAKGDLLADEVIDQLLQDGRCRVACRITVPETHGDPREQARKANVAWIVEGSICADDAGILTVRIRLISGITGHIAHSATSTCTGQNAPALIATAILSWLSPPTDLAR